MTDTPALKSEPAEVWITGIGLATVQRIREACLVSTEDLRI